VGFVGSGPRTGTGSPPRGAPGVARWPCGGGGAPAHADSPGGPGNFVKDPQPGGLGIIRVKTPPPALVCPARRFSRGGAGFASGIIPELVGGGLDCDFFSGRPVLSPTKRNTGPNRLHHRPVLLLLPGAPPFPGPLGGWGGGNGDTSAGTRRAKKRKGPGGRGGPALGGVTKKKKTPTGTPHPGKKNRGGALG